MAAKPIQLPPPAELHRTTRGLATLDAILSDDWEFRYYSFDAKWGRGLRMASMRNGEGDDWFLVFAGDRAFLKGFAHEYPRGNPETIFAGLPKALAPQRKEPAFSIDDISYGGWFDGAWTIRVAPKCDKVARAHLALLSGDAKAYRAYAADYFEEDVPVDAIEHVLAGKPLDQKLVKRIAKGRTFASLKSDLAQIGYGRNPTGK